MIYLSYEISRSDCCCRVSRKLTSASSLSELQDGCGIKSVGNNWCFYSLSAAVPFASSEDSSIVLIGAEDQLLRTVGATTDFVNGGRGVT